LLDNSEDTGIAVMLRERGYDCRSCGTCDTTTHVPETWTEFYGQRRLVVTIGT
ncbi:unnamed protein product, partial [Choristocarpus tenellus]